jgi:uncharacterized protein
MGDAETDIRSVRSVRVFGSAVVRVSPDSASIVVAVSRTEQKPEMAFAGAREGAQAVNAFLRKSAIQEFGSSRVTLVRKHRYINGEDRFVGYTAKIQFNVVLREMDQLEGLLSRLIEAGADELTSMTFQTTRLKELRAESRRRAVVAAREKAELYCSAAGVAVGGVLAVEDVNPESVSGRSEGHTYHETAPADDTGEPGAIDPGAITVAAAVRVVYGIEARV